MNRRSGTSLGLLCWEGYDAESIARRFEQRHARQLHAETLLSDSAVADELLAGKHPRCDLLNINNAYVRDLLHPAGMVRSLDAELNERYRASIHPSYQRFLPWSYSHDGELIGIGQRYGPFNMVINSDAISAAHAEQEGFRLADDPRHRKRYAILDYPDFNLFHVCIGAGIDPFRPLSADDFEAFRRTGARWLQHALMVDDDHHRLNRALADNEIDFYISGGIYTVSPARLQGCLNLLAVTPTGAGPADGKGGIAFTEITSVLQQSRMPSQARSFLDFMLEAETAVAIAFIDGTCNPVAQMGDPAVLRAFSREQLQAIQWDTLDHQLQHCADYRVPPDRHALLAILGNLKNRNP